jgi:hypothetical protein
MVANESALAPIGVRRRDGNVLFGRQDSPDSRVRSRHLGAAIGPCLEIVYRVDDASPNLPIGRAGAIGTVLLQRAPRQAQKARGFRGSEIPWRKAGCRVGPARGSVVLAKAVDGDGGSVTTVAKNACVDG